MAERIVAGGIDTVPLVRRVLFEIRDRIIFGDFPENRWLRIADLAAEIGTSVTPVRAALGELQTQGLVQVAKARGFRVHPPTADDIVDAYMLIGFVVGELNARAARRVDDALLAELEAIQARLEGKIERGDGRTVDQANWDFHRTIHLRADSPIMARTLRTVIRSVPNEFHRLVPGWNEKSVADHHAMIAALARGDEEGARRLAYRHQQEGCERFLRAIAVKSKASPAAQHP